MDDFLKYLTADDRKRLLAAAEHVRFEPDAVVLAQGERRHAIFLIRSGSVRVERNHGAYAIEISRLGAGEVFGEMSFVEGFEASASIVAAETAEIDVFEGAAVDALVAEHPGFHGRFYQSLAEILSRRLRETTYRSIAEYSWGGYDVQPVRESARGGAEDAWGGGNPFQQVESAV